MSEQLRAYHFENFYLQGIHAGIQTAHSLVEMAAKYRYQRISGDDTKHDVNATMFWQWAENNKTVIVLNGGTQIELEELIKLLQREECTLPWDFFKEDAGLNFALTNVGVIVPDRIYDYDPNFFYALGETPQLTPWEKEFHIIMKKCPLMR